MEKKGQGSTSMIDPSSELGLLGGTDGRQNGVVTFQPEQRLALLWRNRRALWQFTACGMAIATVITFCIPKSYRSSARLMPPEASPTRDLAMLAATSSSGGAGALGGMGGLASLLGMKSPGAVFVEILKSRTVQDRLIERFDLRKVYWASHWEDARSELASRTTITEERKSGVIYISVTDHDPKRAAALAQAYVDDLNKLAAELSTSSARRERIFLEDRLKEVQEDLYSAEKTFSEFSTKNTTLDIKEQGRAMLNAAAEIEGQLIVSQAQLRGLEQIYTASNVRVRSAQSRVNELQRQLGKLGGVVVVDKTGKDELPYPSIRQLPVLGVTYADMYRRVKVQETAFEVLTKLYELAKVEEARETPTVRVLDAPVVPERKSFPPRLLIIALGALLSFCLGAACIVSLQVWERTDPTNPTKVVLQEAGSSIRDSRMWTWAKGRRSRLPWTRSARRVRRDQG